MPGYSIVSFFEDLPDRGIFFSIITRNILFFYVLCAADTAMTTEKINSAWSVSRMVCIFLHPCACVDKI